MELLRGTLDLLILQALSVRAMHGYEIARWLERTTHAALTIEEGSLYPALHRIAKRGWIVGEWGRTDSNRRVKVYRLTDDGQRQLATASAGWDSFVDAVAKVMKTAPDPLD